MKDIPDFAPQSYEKKWRAQWEEEQVYRIDNPINASKPKYYCLDMFPYPSGEGLHVGHWRGYVLSDVWVRYKLLEGYNVLHPMGWDNFGLPAENDAIKKGTHPRVSTKKNIDNMRRQLQEIGCAYDWSREIDTTHPDYYKWTQYIFLKFFEHGLAYQELHPVNWCNSCKVVLANEEVAGGVCERCGGVDIEKRPTKQWMLRITKYADKLLDDLDALDWPDKVKEMQRNWIGRSIGASVFFPLENVPDKTIEVFTTRPDTLFGATFMVVSPEHPIVEHIVSDNQKNAVKEYIAGVQCLSNVDRQAKKDKDGIFSGTYAINPVTNKRIPIWIASYVLMDYGTGAIMAVPAHDERDFEFAQKHGIPIVEVIQSNNAVRNANGELSQAYTGNGVLINSTMLNGKDVDEAKNTILEFLEKQNLGKKAINYKLRDWIFARQRYWGEPIPIVYCDECGAVPVPYDQLPVELPDVESYKPTADGSSPLAAMTDWVNTSCPICAKPAKRETDTMPQWAGSSWYFIRYPDKYYAHGLASPESLKNWLPVDMYVGGIEHAVLHLLYARFWTKFLFDEKIIPFNEPFIRLFNQGMVVRRAHRCHPCNRWVYDAEIDFGKDSRECPDCGSKLEASIEKMSKSKGNGVSPDHLVENFGTDSLRLYELFAGDPALDSEWNDDGLKACHNLLKRSWNFLYSTAPAPESSVEASRAINRLVKNVEQRILAFKFNTAVSAIMEFINDAIKLKGQFSPDDVEKFVVVLSPFAPHFAEEVWHVVLNKSSHVFHQKYPTYDENLLQSDTIEYAVQINGKVRMKIVVPSNSDKEAILEVLWKDEKFNNLAGGKTIKKVIHVPERLINFIV